ncbi:hypothetical protein [Maribacter sp. R77961]|uniref:hypothetical protein n=1 Tax=Maribacter sp. R77961 TaxID=3093871 RepID=UPI0037C7455B
MLNAITMKSVFVLILVSLFFISCTHFENHDSILTPQNSEFVVGEKAIDNKYLTMPMLASQEHFNMPFPSQWLFSFTDVPRVGFQNSEDVKFFYPVNYFYNDVYSWGDTIQQPLIRYDIASDKQMEALVRAKIFLDSDLLELKLVRYFDPIGLRSISKIKDSITIWRSNNEEMVCFRASEYVDANQKKTLFVIEQVQMQPFDNSAMSYVIHSMEAPIAKYEASKKIFLHSLENMQPCFKFIFEKNKKAIGRVTKNFTAQYFTIKESKERRNQMLEEEKRTGTYEYDTYKKYYCRLLEKHPHLNESVFESCVMYHSSNELDKYDETYWGQKFYDIYRPEKYINLDSLSYDEDWEVAR